MTAAAESECVQVSEPGRLMAKEIAEQPEVLARILDEGLPQIRQVAAQIKAAGPRFVVFAARGTSDHAALYAKYLFEILLGWPAGLASPSTMTAYGAKPDLRDVLFVGVSQSGGSPDLVGSLRTARECGALTLAVTNAPGSPLAEQAQLHIDVRAGSEKAVAATKSYTAELLALYLLVDALRDGDGSAARGLVDATSGVVSGAEQVRSVAARFAGVERLVVTGRGYSYPTAREAALKLMETSYIPALAFSGADLLHGPLAMVDNVFPVIAVVTEGRGGTALQPVLDRLRGRGADLVVVGSREQVEAASAGFVLPTAGVAEEVQPILEIIPLQMLAHEVTIARGQDPDAPRALAKVTETR